jgi:hypothetical protein
VACLQKVTIAKLISNHGKVWDGTTGEKVHEDVDDSSEYAEEMDDDDYSLLRMLHGLVKIASFIPSHMDAARIGSKKYICLARYFSAEDLVRLEYSDGQTIDVEFIMTHGPEHEQVTTVKTVLLTDYVIDTFLEQLAIQKEGDDYLNLLGTASVTALLDYTLMSNSCNMVVVLDTNGTEVSSTTFDFGCKTYDDIKSFNVVNKKWKAAADTLSDGQRLVAYVYAPTQVTYHLKPFICV